MRVNKPVSGIRYTNDALMKTWVIIGDGERAGHIKTINFHQNVCPAILNIEWARGHDGRASRLKGFQVDSDLQDRGWRILQEVYDEENRLEDWETFLEYQDACKVGKVDVEFPLDLLPEYCAELRRRVVNRVDKWKRPEKLKKAKSGKSQLATGVSVSD